MGRAFYKPLYHIVIREPLYHIVIREFGLYTTGSPRKLLSVVLRAAVLVVQLKDDPGNSKQDNGIFSVKSK